MGYRKRRGYVHRPSDTAVSRYYAPAKAAFRIAAGNKGINYRPPVPWITGQPPRTTPYKGKPKKKKVKTGEINSGSAGHTYSRSGKAKPTPAYMREYQVQFNYLNDKGLQEWTSAQQKYAVPQFCLDSVDLAAWQGGSNDFSFGANNNNKIDLFVKNVSGQLTLKNMYSTQCKVTMYLCHMKQNADQSPLEMIKEGTAAAYNEVPLSSVKYELLNHNPTMSGVFMKNVKIDSAKSIILDPGSIHEHKFQYAINKKFSVSNYDKEIRGNNMVWIGGWTRFILLRFQGTPVVSDTNVLTVSTSAGKCIWTYDQKVNYILCNTLKQKNDAAGFIASIGVERNMNEESDVVVTNTKA